MVFPDTLIAETTLQPEEPVHFPITEAFGIPPYQIHDVLRVKTGDVITREQVIAAGYVDGQGAELRSPVAGVIEQVSILLGTASLRLEGDPNDRDKLVDVAKDLEMLPLLAAQYVQVRVGDFVQMGQLLASDTDKEAMSLSPIQGQITNINGSVVTVTRPHVRTGVNAFRYGKVTEIITDYGAVIESHMVPLTGVFGLGGESFGVLRILVDDPAGVADISAVNEDCTGCIVVAGALATPGLLKKCKEVGVAGVIAGGAHNLNLVELLGEEISPGMETGSTLGLTLMLTEGMGETPVDDSIFRLLQQAEGENVSLSGLTQIRSGVIRPCVYLPAVDIVTVDPDQGNTAEITEGSRVRIIREPFFGVRGIVRELSGPDTLSNGIRTLTYLIITDRGDELRIPRSNVEPV